MSSVISVVVVLQQQGEEWGFREVHAELPEGADVVTREVVLPSLSPASTLSGLVHDEHGQPVGGLELGVSSLSGRGMYTTRSLTDGRFLFSLKYPGLAEGRTFRVGLPSRTAFEFEMVRDGGEVPWGSNDLAVVVRRKPTHVLRVRAVDGRTGEPLPRFGMTCSRLRRGGAPSDKRAAEPEERPGGRAVVDGLPAGRYLVSVFPEPPFLEADRMVEVPAGAELEVAVFPASRLRVRLVDEGGKPLEGTEVVLLKPIPPGQSFEDPTRYSVPLANLRRGRGGSTAPFLGELDRRTTGGGGLVALHGPAGRDDLHVKVLGPDAVPRIVPGVSLGMAGSMLEIVARRAGVLHGRVEPMAFVNAWGPTGEERARAEDRARYHHRVEAEVEAELAEEYPTVVARPRDGGRARRTHVRPDGTFTLDALEPGTYDLCLGVRVRDGTTSLYVHSSEALATIDIKGSVEVVLRAEHLLPGRLHGIFLEDGVPLADAEVGVARRTGSGRLQRHSGWRTDALGRGTSYRLLPGRYLPFAVVGRGDSGGRILWGTRFVDLPPGGEVQVTASLTSRSLTLRLRDSDLKASGRRRVLVDALDHPVGLRHLFTGSDGVLDLTPAPPGRLRVMVYADAALDRQPFDRDELPPTHELAVLAADRTGAVDLVIPR